MQVIYLLPFFLASIGGGVVCLRIPRLRGYVLSAAVAPIAFAICSIVGMLFTILAAEHFGIAETLGFNRPIDGNNIFFAALVYGLHGLIGAAIAVIITKRAQRWMWKAR